MNGSRREQVEPTQIQNMYPHFHNTGQANVPRIPMTHAHVGNVRHHVTMPALETTPSTTGDKSETTSELHKAKTRLAQAILQHEQFKDILENAIASPDSLTQSNMADLNNKKVSAFMHILIQITFLIITLTKVQLQNMLSELSEKSKLEQLKDKRARQKRKRVSIHFFIYIAKYIKLICYSRNGKDAI